jgi:hypothetical protein
MAECDCDANEDDGTSDRKSGDANREAEWHSDRLANAEPHSDADLHVIQDAEQNAHTYPDIPAGTSSSYRHSRAARANQHGRANGNRYSPNLNGHPDADRYFRCGSHGHSDGHRYCSSDGYPHVYADVHLHNGADRHAHGDRNRYPHAHRHGGTDRHAYGDSNGYSDAHRHGGTDRHANAHADGYPDLDAH